MKKAGAFPKEKRSASRFRLSSVAKRTSFGDIIPLFYPGFNCRAAIFSVFSRLLSAQRPNQMSGGQMQRAAIARALVDDPDSEIRQYLGENGVLYGYAVAFSVFSNDEEGRFVDTDSDPEESPAAGRSGMMGMFSSMMSDSAGAENFSQLMAGTGGETVSQVVTDSYELLHGQWPKEYDEAVLERTKEIGILRALGASKGNISQVFNAETFIIGCCSGLIGIGVTVLFLVPINSIISRISGIEGLSAQLPAVSAAVLIIISIVVTVLGGLLPAKKAAKKDPVIALRTE